MANHYNNQKWKIFMLYKTAQGKYLNIKIIKNNFSYKINNKLIFNVKTKVVLQISLIKN